MVLTVMVRYKQQNNTKQFIHLLLIADINECSKGTHECSNGCTNTVGSYLCYCPTGYELDAGLKTCVGKKDDGGHTVYIKVSP